MAYVPRLTDAGIRNNPMWYSDNYFYQIGYGMPNCTCYCYGRIYENTGAKPTYCPTGNAWRWWDQWPSNMDKGQIPRLGSVLVKEDPTGYYVGHVEVVEDIMPNGDIITSNSNYGGTFFYTRTLKASQNYLSDWEKNNGWRKRGFLYLPGNPEFTEWIKGNRYLNQEEMDNNALLVWSKLYSLGWSLNAVCGLLGNLWRESTINPGIWQNLVQNPANGYGLAQWTPSTNWTDYATQQGWNIDDGYRQLEFIDSDPINNYIPTSAYPETLAEFKISGKSPEDLASAWLYNYERAGVAAEDERRRWARYYYDILEGVSPFFPPTTQIIGLKIWQMIKYRI